MAMASTFIDATTNRPDRHSVLHAQFTSRQQRTMAIEDSKTWRTVSLELVSVVTFGLLGMTASVIYIALTY